jgi:hypothetical protein
MLRAMTLPAALRRRGTRERDWGNALEERQIKTVLDHFALGLVPIRILDAAGNPERSEQLVPTRDVKRMCRPRAQGPQAQSIEGHVEGDQPVLWSIKNEVAAQPRAGEYPESEE